MDADITMSDDEIELFILCGSQTNASGIHLIHVIITTTTQEPQQRLLNRWVFFACRFYHVTPGFRRPRYFYIYKNRIARRRLCQVGLREVGEAIILKKAFIVKRST